MQNLLDTKTIKNDHKKCIYLIGSFMINDNYGDVIQAKLWVDWYRKNGWKIIYICRKSGLRTCQNVLKLSKNEILTIDEFLTNTPINKFMHLYGGGYLNQYWAGDFLKAILHAEKYSLEVFATGVQVDDAFINMSKGLHVDYISVRDDFSKKILKQNSLIADDSFGYFFVNRHFYNLSKKLSSLLATNKVLLQLSLNAYVFDGVNEKHIVDELKNFIIELDKKYELVFCSSFPEHIEGIVENKKLIDKLGLNPSDYSYKTTMEIDKELITNYKFAVINSFHTYMMMFFKTNRPIFYLAFDSYYKQKANALKNYGMLQNNCLLDTPEMIRKILEIDFSKKSFFNANLVETGKTSSKIFSKVSEKLYNAS